MRATGYKFTAPPMVSAGATATLTASLVGGLDIDQALVITPTARSVAFSGPITIHPGETSGSATFVPGPLPTPPDVDPSLPPEAVGARNISATLLGGNQGMQLARYGWFTVVSPEYPPASGFGFSVHPPPSPSQGPFLVSVWLTGGWVLTEVLEVSFVDDLGGQVVGPVRVGQRLGTGLQFGPESDYAIYRPAAAGTRTIRVAAVGGGNPGIDVPGPVTIEVDPSQVRVSSDSGPVGLPTGPSLPAFDVPTFTPIYPKATDFTIFLLNSYPGYSVDSATVAIVAPVGVAQVVFVRLSGGLTLDAPLVLTLSDAAGGLFPDGPVTLTGDGPGPGRQFAYTTYIPTTAGLRTVSGVAAGGNFEIAGSVRSSSIRLLATPA